MGGGGFGHTLEASEYDQERAGGGGGGSAEGDGGGGGGGGLGTRWKPLTSCKRLENPNQQPRAAGWGQWQRSEGGERWQRWGEGR